MKKLFLALFLAFAASVSAQDITFAGISMHNKPSDFLYYLKNNGFTLLYDYGKSVSVSGTFLDRQPDFFEVATFDESIVYEIRLGYGFKSLQETYSGFKYNKDEISDDLNGDGGRIIIYRESPSTTLAGGDKLFPQDCHWAVMIDFNCNKFRHYYRYYISDTVNHTVCINGYEFSKFTPDKSGAKDGHLVIPETITINGVPHTVTKVGHRWLDQRNFGDYPDIYSISLPNTVKEIEYKTFERCANLEEITLGSGLKSIGDQAFEGCVKLKTIKLPASLEHIGSDLFTSCTSLESVNVEPGNNSYKSVDGVLFSANGDTLILMPRGFKSTSYNVPNGVKHIAILAILANSLEQIALPDGLLTINAAAFFQLEKLHDIKIPSSLRKLGRSAFYRCYSLVSISLPEGIDTIPDRCFMQCSNLKQVSLPQSLSFIGSLAFADCGVEELSLSENVVAIGNTAFANTFNLKSITVAKGNPFFASHKDVLFTKDGSVLCSFPSAKEGNYSVPKGVTIIENYAFWASRLKSISLPNSLTVIGDYAFYGCQNLPDITIPHSDPSRQYRHRFLQ